MTTTHSQLAYAIEHDSLLTLLATDHGHATKTALAAAIGRDQSNLTKTLSRGEAEGLVATGGLTLTDAGHAALEALTRAIVGQSAGGAEGAPDGYVALHIRQLFPDELNPRKHFDPEAIAELAASIARDGLLENLVVRRDPKGIDAITEAPGGGELRSPVYRIVAGERRYRAILKLLSDGAWAYDQLVTCKIVNIDDASHRRIALVENLQRKDLRPIDEANALKELMAVTGASTADVAGEIGFTQRFVQQRLQLLDLPDALQDRVNDATLPIEKARVAIALLPKLPPIKQVEVIEGKLSVDDAKEWLDRQPKPLELTPLQWLIALELTDAIKRSPMKKASYEYDRTEVAAAAKDDGQLQQLVQSGLFSAPSGQQDKHYQHTGHFYVSENYSKGRILDAKFGEVWRPGGDDLQTLLAAQRAEAAIEGDLPAGTYVTAWLNGPFEIPADVAATYAATLAKRKKAEAAEKAERDRAKAAAEERKAAAGSNAERVHQLVSDLAGRSPAPCDPRFPEVLATAGLSLPWRIEGDRAKVVAADGVEILWGIYDLDQRPEVLAQRVLLVAAVNLAAGVAFTVEPDAAPSAADDDDDQLDIEDAVAASAEPPEALGVDEDPTLTPALKRLAGVATPAEAH